MSDPILEELWRVRAELIKKNGGIDGYFSHVQKLDRARRRKKAKKAKTRKAKSTS